MTPILDKLQEYKRNRIHYVNRMPRSRLPRFFFWRDNPLVGLDLLIHQDFLWFRDHTQRPTTVGRTPLDE